MKINLFSIKEVQNCNAIKNNKINNKFALKNDVFVKSTPIEPAFKGTLEENVSKLKSAGFKDFNISQLSEENIEQIVKLLDRNEIKTALKNEYICNSDLMSVKHLNKNNNNLFTSIVDDKKILNYLEKGKANISEIVDFVFDADVDDVKTFLATINNNEFEDLIEKNRIRPVYDVPRFIYLNKQQKNNLVELINSGLTSYEALQIAEFDGEKCEKAKELFEKGISAENVKNFVNLEENLYKRVIELTNCNATETDISICLDMDEEIYPKVFNLVKEGFSAFKSYVLANGDEKAYEKALEYKKCGLSADGAYQVCTMEPEQQKKVLELARNGMNTYNACFVATTAFDEDYDKILELTKLGVEYYAIDKIAHSEGTVYKKTVDLIKAGVPQNCAYNLAQNNDEIYEKILTLISKNIPQNAIIELQNKFSDKIYIDQINSYTDDSVNIYDADSVITKPEIQNLYNKFVDKGYNSKQSSILANIKNTEEYNCEDLATLIDKTDCFNNIEECPSKVISDFLVNNPNLDIKSFNEYLSKIDFEKLLELAPQVKNYSKSDFLKFANYHFSANDVNLDKKTLELCDDFTDFIKNNYINATEMDNILTVFPLTERNLGEIPAGWINDTDDKQDKNEIKNKVSQLFDEFRTNRNTNVLESEMRNLLKKDVKISEIASGDFGTTYKISVPNAVDTCLKIFFEMKDNDPKYLIHGVLIEPQTAIFANNNSNEFVKTYMARVTNSKEKNGFILTQFLNRNIKPVETNTAKNNVYKFITNDTSKTHNKINGIVFDFGAVEVKKQDGTKANRTIIG